MVRTEMACAMVIPSQIGSHYLLGTHSINLSIYNLLACVVLILILIILDCSMAWVYSV
jgi:hypothetical protein